ncbi:MAG TPA: hypothetical protein VK483_07470 [Chitinophagaceae bacterium]|nr:hypothetical protein [Chitinophagaceae bacterium]
MKWPFRVSKTWNLGIFKEKQPFDIVHGARPENLVFTLSGRKLRTRYKHVATYADPFLFQNDGKLFLFAEAQPIGEVGYIHCWQYVKDSKWQDMGPVLKEAHHHSYPFIFRDSNGKIYMLPESHQSKEISLWEFSNFPLGLKKVKTILHGAYVDSNIILYNGTYYLFTKNDKHELLIFHSTNLLSGEWTAHKANPVTNDLKFSRNGGGIMMHENKLIRVAQNGASMYGGGIVILSVDKLDENEYRESVIEDDYKPVHNYIWQRRGRHHLSLCDFNGNTFVAMDGFADNLFINFIINGIYKILR